MRIGLHALGWLSWKAADITAWIFEAVPDGDRFVGMQERAYGLYHRSSRFAFWLDERFDLGQTGTVEFGQDFEP